MKPSLSPLLAFALRFLALFAVLLGAFEAARGTSFERIVIEDGLLRPATWLIQQLTPGEAVHLHGRSIDTPVSHLHVVRGCEGIETLLLLVAAIAAYPAAWRARARALAGGAALAYALSLGRLVALHLSLRYSPQAWEMLHGLVLPLAPVVAVGLYFLHWSGGLQRTTHDAH